MKKVVILSDTHNQLFHAAVPDGDVLIHCGDATALGTIREIIDFGNQMRKYRHKHKIFIPGNHDILFEQDFKRAKEALGEGIKTLLDQEVTIEGLRIWGSPWTPDLHDWAFGLKRGEELKKKWQSIPTGIDILITHGPPFGILDLTTTGDNAGCEALTEEVVRIGPKVHCFGHIHSGYGVEIIGGIQFVNASICREDYQGLNLPIVIELDENRIGI